jgi:hypothetical protein
MMESKTAGFVLLYRLVTILLLLLSFSCNEVMAWQQSSDNRKHRHHKSCDGPKNVLPPSPRREFFLKIARTASIAAIATTAATTTTSLILPNQAGIAAAAAPATISTDSARSQWKDAAATLDDLLNDWPMVATKGGDAIRMKLGTQGTSSPLFQIDKAFKALRDSDFVDDFIEFQETSEEFGLALSRADSMAYSANFAGGSGKPTPPAFYIEKSKTEVVEMQRIAKKLDAMVK